jgi:Tfp pilus assembly protein PilX
MQRIERRQHGAALVVGLVLLMVLTVLAISTMRTATLELTMAGNAQYRENAFQLAESGLDTTLQAIEQAGPAALPNVPCDPEPAWGPEVEIAVLGGHYQTRVCLAGSTLDYPGSSIGQFRQLHYRVESRGRAQRNAESVHARGFYVQVQEQ